MQRNYVVAAGDGLAAGAAGAEGVVAAAAGAAVSAGLLVVVEAITTLLLIRTLHLQVVEVEAKVVAVVIMVLQCILQKRKY